MGIVPFDKVPSCGLLTAGLLGCGFLKIDRAVLDKIVDKGLATPYGVEAHAKSGSPPNYQFFNGRVYKDNLLSEDYSFSVMAREAGVQPYVNCSIRLTHDGRTK